MRAKVPGERRPLSQNCSLKKNVYSQDCAGDDLSISPETKKGVYFISDQTVFFPTGGGQAATSAKLTEFPRKQMYGREEGRRIPPCDTVPVRFHPAAQFPCRSTGIAAFRQHAETLRRTRTVRRILPLFTEDTTVDFTWKGLYDNRYRADEDSGFQKSPTTWQE